MWDELENFLKKSKNIDSQIEKLQERRANYQQKIKKTEEEINRMVMDEATLGKAPNEEKIERLENRIERQERKIARLDQRTQAVKDHKNDVLKEYVPGLYDSYKKQMEEARLELEELEKNIIPKAAEYMRLLREIGKGKTKMKRIHDTFTNAVEGFEDVIKNNYAYPSIGEGDAKMVNLINNAGVKMFVSEWPYTNTVRKGITVQDQLYAVNGKGLPSHIALYLLTGEQEMDLDKAREKMQMVRRVKRENPSLYKDIVNNKVSLGVAFNKLGSVKEENKEQEKVNKIQKEIKKLEKQRRKAESELDFQTTHDLTLKIGRLKDKRREIRGLK